MREGERVGPKAEGEEQAAEGGVEEAGLAGEAGGEGGAGAVAGGAALAAAREVAPQCGCRRSSKTLRNDCEQVQGRSVGGP